MLCKFEFRQPSAKNRLVQHIYSWIIRSIAFGSRRRMLFLRRYLPLVSPVLISVIVGVFVFLIYKPGYFSSAKKSDPNFSGNEQDLSSKKDQDGKEVFGDKTQDDSQDKNRNSASVSNPVPFALTSAVEEPGPESQLDGQSFKIPEYLLPYSGNSKLNKRQGSLQIRFYADWVHEEFIIFWGNFDGKSKENLFEIAGRGPFLMFNTYDENGIKDSLEAHLGGDYKGRIFEVEAKWDFNGNLWQKTLYVNGELFSEEELNPATVRTNAGILIETSVEVLKIAE